MQNDRVDSKHYIWPPLVCASHFASFYVTIKAIVQSGHVLSCHCVGHRDMIQQHGTNKLGTQGNN